MLICGKGDELKLGTKGMFTTFVLRLCLYGKKAVCLRMHSHC